MSVLMIIGLVIAAIVGIIFLIFLGGIAYGIYLTLSKKKIPEFGQSIPRDTKYTEGKIDSISR